MILDRDAVKNQSPLDEPGCHPLLGVRARNVFVFGDQFSRGAGGVRPHGDPQRNPSVGSGHLRGVSRGPLSRGGGGTWGRVGPRFTPQSIRLGHEGPLVRRALFPWLGCAGAGGPDPAAVPAHHPSHARQPDRGAVPSAVCQAAGLRRPCPRAAQRPERTILSLSNEQARTRMSSHSAAVPPA